MRLGLYQAPSPAGDLPAGLAAVDRALAGAAETGVQMLVMPELFLPGYNADPRALPADWDSVPDRLAEMCRAHGVALTIGLAEPLEGRIYNTALALSETGAELARYRKVQLFGPREAELFAPGDRLCVFDHGGVRFGLLICYDVEFPEHVRALARAGARVILVPTANPLPFVNVNQLIVPARAAENAVTIVYCNLCGTEGDLTYAGLSAIFGPDGYILAAKGQSEGLSIAELPGGWHEHGIPLATQLTDFRPVDTPQ